MKEQEKVRKRMHEWERERVRSSCFSPLGGHCETEVSVPCTCSASTSRPSAPSPLQPAWCPSTGSKRLSSRSTASGGEGHGRNA